MLVVRFARSGQRNCVVIAGAPFVYACTRLGSFVLPARCPHRGGPLHLADLEHDKPRLVCPWHGRRSSIGRCINRGIPTSRRGELITAVFPHPSGTAYTLEHRPLSPDLVMTSLAENR
jgi:nitrite reductase (NADH) small subunit